MSKKKVYCETCEHVVVLRRKNFDHMYHEVLCILTIATLGLGYLILRFMKKKNTCPNCQSEFDLKNLGEYKKHILTNLNHDKNDNLRHETQIKL